MRRAIACTRCRAVKRKCTSVTEDGCLQCKRYRQHCSLATRKADHRSLTPISPKPNVSASKIQFSAGGKTVDFSDAVVTELVQNYLRLIHDRPHSLFHKASLWDDIQSKSIPKHLLYSICSLGCSLSRDAELHSLNKPLSLEAKRLFQADLESVSLASIQTLILLANICAAELSPSSETLYFGIANRMAHILKLHEPNDGDNAVVRETKSRIWWTLFMADYWCSAGLGLPRQLYTTSKIVELPIDEEAFQNARSSDTVIRAPSGLWAYMLTLAEIFPEVQDLNRRLVDGSDGLDDAKTDETVLQLSQRMDEWLVKLPSDKRLTDVNVRAHTARGLGGAFVALHLGYHHYSTLLYFQYLDMQRPATTTSTAYAQRCRQHASEYSDLLRKSREMAGCEAVYATVGHMTVVSSSVLLHMLFFADERDLDATRAHLNSNFLALIEMMTFWPSLERTVNGSQYVLQYSPANVAHRSPDCPLFKMLVCNRSIPIRIVLTSGWYASYWSILCHWMSEKSKVPLETRTLSLPSIQGMTLWKENTLLTLLWQLYGDENLSSSTLSAPPRRNCVQEQSQVGMSTTPTATKLFVHGSQPMFPPLASNSFCLPPELMIRRLLEYADHCPTSTAFHPFTPAESSLTKTSSRELPFMMMTPDPSVAPGLGVQIT